MRHITSPSSFLSSIWVEIAYDFLIEAIDQTPGRDTGGLLALPVPLSILRALEYLLPSCLSRRYKNPLNFFYIFRTFSTAPSLATITTFSPFSTTSSLSACQYSPSKMT